MKQILSSRMCRPRSSCNLQKIGLLNSSERLRLRTEINETVNLYSKRHYTYGIYTKAHGLVNSVKFFSTIEEEKIAAGNQNIIISSADSAPIDHLNRVTDRLLESKIGSLNQASILEITTSISSWHAHAISNPREEHSYDRAEALLYRLVDEFFSKNCSVRIQSQIGIDTINRVLDAWRIICNETAPSRFMKRSSPQSSNNSMIHRGVKVLRRLCEPAHNIHLQPNDKSFNIIFDSYAKYGMTEEARTLLEEMLEISNNGQPQCRPDTITYNTLISAYANAIHMSTSSNDKITHAKAAIDILHDMLDLYNETKSPDIKPDVISFSTVIAACANAATVSESFAQNAEDILDQMIEMYHASLAENGGDGEWLTIMPTHICYSSVINAWSNSGASNAVDRATRIFEEMQGKDVGVSDANNIESTTALIGAYANCESKNGIHQAEALLLKAQDSGDAASMPTSFTYTAFIDCLAQSASRALDGDGGEAAMKAEAVVKEMKEMYEHGNHKVKPCTITMNALINVWAKTQKYDGSGERAAYWLEEMENGDDITPDATTYTSVIDAYGRSGQSRKAERVLSRMIHAAKMGNETCTPTMFSFSSAINAYANNGKPKDAVRILDLMKTLRNNEGWIHLKPDSFCYNGIINAHLKSRQKDSLVKCIELLKEMERDGVATAVSHTAVIEGLSKAQHLPGGKRMIGETAVDLLNRMWHLYNSGRNEMKPSSGKNKIHLLLLLT